jgi:hypothetical protein
MKIGTQVTYTQKGYARDFIYTMTNLTAINNLKEEEYTERKGVIINIEKDTYTVKWLDIGGYFGDDISYVYNEDIQEREEQVVEAQPTNKENKMNNNQRAFNKLFNDKIQDITLWMKNGYSFDDAFEVVMQQSVAGPKVKDAIIKHFTK